MDQNFDIINMTSATVSEGTETIAVAICNNADSQSILNNVQFDYDSLTTDEKAIADAFIEMVREKVLASGGSDGGS